MEGSAAVLARMAGHSRSRFSCKSALRPESRVPARARVCPGWCVPRLVPTACLLFRKQPTPRCREHHDGDESEGDDSSGSERSCCVVSMPTGLGSPRSRGRRNRGSVTLLGSWLLLRSSCLDARSALALRHRRKAGFGLNHATIPSPTWAGGAERYLRTTCQVLQARRPTGLGLIGSAMPQTTSVKMNIARNTLWALCTAIPIQALRYRFVGYEIVNMSRSVPGIAHGTCRW